MEHVVRWGILGPGAIGGAFAAALAEAEGAELAAVGSRDEGRARAFAARYGIPRAHGSYGALAADVGIDAVYIATPHVFHERDTILCLDRGKHVLCEKPLAINARQAKRMMDTARDNDRLLMEAMWTRFLPTLEHARLALADGRIGDPRVLTTDFGVQPAFDPASRLFDPALGGGALLDLGVYTVSLAQWFLGEPVAVAGTAHIGPTGVDDDAAFVLKHADGRTAMGYASFRVTTPREAVIHGTEGWIRLHEPWWGASQLTIKADPDAPVARSFALRGGGYSHMAAAFMDLIRGGRRDSDIMPLADSLSVMRTMDRLRAQWGLRYPGEDG